jgi:SAM-dependent methyltransferase
MAKTAQFANMTFANRKATLRNAETLAEEFLLPFNKDLFSSQIENDRQALDFNSSQDEILRTLVKAANKNSFVQNIITNSITRYMGYRPPHTPKDFFRALRELTRIIESISYSEEECRVFHCDARSVPLADNSVDLIITSPPYINVFNYHQNNRPAMELIGWDLLNIAKSEIGSNRKNRQNRFLTVVQYALDMLDVLIEMRRLLKPNGRAIIIVGKESNVRGASFKNGILVASLALGGAGFHLEAIQERKFINKFGETIYEDILHLVPGTNDFFCDSNIARSIAIWHLDQAIVSDKQIELEILDAKKRASVVPKSPIFNLPTAPYRKTHLLDGNKVFEERGDYMIVYPTPHREKLEATLTNDKLPKRDEPHIEEAIQHYKQWIADMDSIISSTELAKELLEKMVSLLNQYRIRMDIDLIFSSQDDWLYRQKGQLKLDNRGVSSTAYTPSYYS